MAVIRVNKTADYTVISNTHFREKEMSLKAKGLLSLMLSLPDSWDYSVAGLVTLSSDGKASITKALNELEKFGYVRRTLAKDENGKFNGYDYDIYEQPFTVFPSTENPSTENPSTVFPSTENPPQLNTNISNTNGLNTNVLNISGEESPKIDFKKEFEMLWKLYPNKKGKDKALSAYIKARKKGVEFATVENGIKAYAKECEIKKREKQYIKHGSTWFNNAGWDDEYDLTPNRPQFKQTAAHNYTRSETTPSWMGENMFTDLDTLDAGLDEEDQARADALMEKLKEKYGKDSA